VPDMPGVQSPLTPGSLTLSPTVDSRADTPRPPGPSPQRLNGATGQQPPGDERRLLDGLTTLFGHFAGDRFAPPKNADEGFQQVAAALKRLGGSQCADFITEVHQLVRQLAPQRTERAFAGVDATTTRPNETNDTGAQPAQTGSGSTPRSNLGALSLKALALTHAHGGTLNKSQLAEAVKTDPSLQPVLDHWDAIFGAEGVAESKNFDPARNDTAGGDILNQYDNAVNTQRSLAALQPSDVTPRTRRPEGDRPNEQTPLVPSTWVPVNTSR
jgi:hypothetical protein